MTNKIKITALRLQMCIKCVPTHRFSNVRMQYSFRISATQQCIGSLVQRALDLNSNFRIPYMTELGTEGRSRRKCEPTLWAPFPVPKVWPSQWDRLWERSFSVSGGLASLGDQWPTPLFLHWEKSCKATTMRAWSPHYSEFFCSRTQIRLIAFINCVDHNELVAS